MALDDDELAGRDPLPTTLSRTTRELRAIVASVEDLEHAVGATIDGRHKPKDAHIQELQKLDAIRQKVGGVADFLEALDASLSGGWRVDARGAARFVSLADMAARLGGEDPWRDSAHVAPPEVYELF